MRLRTFRVSSLLIAAAALLGAVSAMAQTAIQVAASTPQQIIHALSTASSTRVPTVVIVAPGQYAFTEVFDTAFGPSRLPPITTHVWIIGEEPQSTVFEPAASGPVMDARAFTVLKGGRLVVQNLTIRDFGLEAGEVFVGGGAAASFGGFLRFDNSRLLGNSTGDELAVSRGGAIVSVNGRLHLENTVLMDNDVTGNGGAVAVLGGSGIIRYSTIRGNRAVSSGAGGAGGGIFVSNATVTVASSTAAANRAGDIGGLSFAGAGGGIANEGTMWITNSAVIENGVEFEGEGGGIRNSGFMRLKNVTVAGNRAGSWGGGIFNRGRLVLRGATIVDNEVSVSIISCDPLPCYGGAGLWSDTRGRVRAARSLFAGNRFRTGHVPPESAGPDCGGIVSSDGYNAVGDGSDCTLQPFLPTQRPTGDLIGLDPLLGELQDSGDPGNAHVPLLDRSPLIDAGDTISEICTALDQIGNRRVDGDYDGRRECDIGAIEYQPPLP